MQLPFQVNIELYIHSFKLMLLWQDQWMIIFIHYFQRITRSIIIMKSTLTSPLSEAKKQRQITISTWNLHLCLIQYCFHALLCTFNLVVVSFLCFFSFSGSVEQLTKTHLLPWQQMKNCKVKQVRSHAYSWCQMHDNISGWTLD